MPSADRIAEPAPLPAISVMNSVPGVGEKLAAQIARRIEDDIIRAGWPVGTVIGSEQALIERYGVSRAVFREAVRIVEHHQVATTRRGPAGGLVVRAPDEAAVATALGVYLEHVGVTLESILRARHIVESLAAVLAPTRITEDGIRVLRDIISRQAGEDPTELGSHHQLHHAIAAATGNPVLVLFVDVLDSLTLRYSAQEYAATRRAASPERRARVSAQVHRDHAAIAEAVIGGDSARAEHLATEHLGAMHRWMISPSTGGGARRIRSTAPGLRSAADGSIPPSKLAETVAGRIRDDVARAGLPVGAVIGSESELLARYSVSRSVLREGVRLLEYHSVARMRRGPGGGLVVGEPDPSATIEATALYLEYSQAGLEDLRIVRDALELGCIDILVERRDPELIERLTELLAAEGAEATPGDRVRIDGDGDGVPVPGTGHGHGHGSDDACAHGHHLHLELARLTGNEALASFVRVLTAIWPRHLAGSPAPAGATSTGHTPADHTPASRTPPDRTPADQAPAARTPADQAPAADHTPAGGVRPVGAPPPDADAQAAHRGIIQAVIDGDRGLARHRMRRHLEALTAMATTAPPRDVG
jgi:DNA-binding FadR family transcriptional regulator